MDSFEFNKIAGAALAALLAIFGTKVLVDEALHVPEPEKRGWVIATAAQDEAAEETAEVEESDEPEVDPIGIRLASADAEAGAKVFRKCSACHVVNEGGPNRVGPNLHGIVGQQVAAVDGFGYSQALQGHGGEWSHEQLDGFLLNPKGWVPGTSMGFAGLRKPEDRANVIAYLRANTPNPPAIETADASEAAAPSDADDAGAQASE